MAAEPYRYRNPDGSLRLDELLGAEHVRHYTRILTSSSSEFAAMQLAMAVQAPRPDDAYGDYAWREPPRGTMTPDGWLMTPEGAPAREASPCRELALSPEICWDVCGYYARLGIHWKATAKQIRLAYLARDPLQEDQRLFYVMSQLLDPVIRRAYDRVPFGGVFWGDREEQGKIEKAAAMQASRQNAEAWLTGEQPTSQGEVLKKWGFDKGVSTAETRERLSGVFRHGAGNDGLGSSLSSWERSWGWYRLSDPYDDDFTGAPPDVLETWQAMVAEAFSAAGLRDKFAVGTWPGHGARLLHDGNKCCIIFIGTGFITQEMAMQAAREYAARANPG